MQQLNQLEIWFVAGSQHLYGQEALLQVETHAGEIAAYLNNKAPVGVHIVFRKVLTDAAAITALCHEANAASHCMGLMAWMHTFSPAKMWIAGLQALQKPLLHLHTQYYRDIPWKTIDMDYMNLHQSAHGGREFGYLNSRMRLRRKVVAGHWKSEVVHKRLASWTRAAAALHDQRRLKVARLGDNMREVAVTEGDKVEAQMVFGYSVNGYGVGELQPYLQAVSEAAIDRLMQEYAASYELAPALKAGAARHAALREAGRIELALRAFLEEGGFQAFTDTFEDLHGLTQLPGIAVQRLMADGYGFGAEGDWKTAALVRAMKVMAIGLEGGNSFMEDYTYHFQAGNEQVLGAHMLEICPSIAAQKPRCEIHPLGIGGKSDPVRLVFEGAAGPALNVAVIDMGHRFRLLLNEVEAVAPEQPLPSLPVARVLWKPRPDLETAATAWILAGGAHHTCFSQNLSSEQLEDFAEMTGIELLVIDRKTDLYRFRQELRWNEAFYGG